MSDQVTIPKVKYDKLIKDQQWLRCLEAAGVDNWDGSSFAHEIMVERGWDDEDE